MICMLSTIAGLRGVIDFCRDAGLGGCGEALQYPYTIVWYRKFSGITVYFIGDQNIIELCGQEHN